MNNVNPANISDSNLNSTDIPDWLWNLPPNLQRDMDTCFMSNSFFDRSESLPLCLTKCTGFSFSKICHCSLYITLFAILTVLKRLRCM